MSGGETGLEDAFTILNINPAKTRFFGPSSGFQYLEVGVSPRGDT